MNESIGHFSNRNLGGPHPVRALREALLDGLADPRCIECAHHVIGETRPTHSRSMHTRARARALCGRCIAALPWWRRVDGCPVCGWRRWIHPSVDGAEGACPGCYARGSALHSCTTLCRFEAAPKRWLPAYKRGSTAFGPNQALSRAVEYLAEQLAGEALRRTTEDHKRPPDLIVGVPTHGLRRLRRGFDHVDAIAAAMAERMGSPWAARLLRRRHPTRKQASLEARARRENLRGAFRCSAPLSAGTTVWLVDDVLTTGNTLEAAADALLNAGAEEVHGFALAATLPMSRRRFP